MEPKATRIMNDFALWLNNRAEYGEAERLYRRALAIDKKELRPRASQRSKRPQQPGRLLSATNRLGAGGCFTAGR